LRQRARVRALKHVAVASSQGQLGCKGGKGGMNWAAAFLLESVANRGTYLLGDGGNIDTWHHLAPVLA